jgi:hypothetical protein
MTSTRFFLALMMETLKTNWQLWNMLKTYTSSTRRLRYVSLSMIADLSECEGNIFIFF